MNGNGLTPKQAAFVREYSKDFNATQAAIRAGYARRGAEVTGFRLLRNPKVAKAVAEQQVKAQRKFELTQEFVINGLVVEASGKHPKGTNPSARVRAQELLGKHLGMFIDKHELTGPNGGPIQAVNLDNLSTGQLEQLAGILSTANTDPAGGTGGTGEA